MTDFIKAIILFICGVIISWIAVWFVNICEWGISLSFGNLLASVIFADVRGFWAFVYSLITMFPYLFIFPCTLMVVGYVEPDILRRIMCFLMGIVVIAIFDPSIKHYLPNNISDYINYLQNNWHFRFMGGADAGNLKWSANFSSLDYIVFDIGTGLLTLLSTFSKSDD